MASWQSTTLILLGRCERPDLEARQLPVPESVELVSCEFLGSPCHLKIGVGVPCQAYLEQANGRASDIEILLAYALHDVHYTGDAHPRRILRMADCKQQLVPYALRNRTFGKQKRLRYTAASR